MRKISGDEIIRGIAKAKNKWLDAQFKKILPKRIYHGMHDPPTRDRCVAWLEEHGYRVMEDNEGIIKIVKGVKVLASIRLTLEIESMEELKQLQKVITIKEPGKA